MNKPAIIRARLERGTGMGLVLKVNRSDSPTMFCAVMIPVGSMSSIMQNQLKISFFIGIRDYKIFCSGIEI